MYFDFEDHRPETPRVSNVVSVREGVLLSIIFHLALVILLLMFPDVLSPSDEPAEMAALQPDQSKLPLTFVEAMAVKDIPRLPDRPAEQSDLDRKATAPEPAPVPEARQPAMRGNTPEMVEGGPTAPASPPPAPQAPPADSQSVASDSLLGRPVIDQPSQQTGPSAPLRVPNDMFRDVGRYARPDRFDNPQGSTPEQSADIQFDTMGVDFGSWLRRFKNQVERNWIIPAAAMGGFRGRVVVRFIVLKNGTLIQLETLQPASEPSLTSAAVNALKLSNPTAQLPVEYPADSMPITVTFHYNEDPRSYR